jgi:nucleoside-diphosphate-sugar epimerase
MKRIVVTGATGFVGANLVRKLLTYGHEVHVLLREKHNDWRIRSIKNDISIHIIDLNDIEDLETKMSTIKPEWIFHLAAYGAYSSQNNLIKMINTNVISTSNLLDACAKNGFEIFLNTGSSSEYGYKDHAPKENEIIDPNSYYAITKASATHLSRFISQSKQINIGTLRLYSVFGPFEEPTRLIPTLITEGFVGKYPPLVNPSIARDFIYIDDVVDAYLLLAKEAKELRGDIFNIGSGSQMTIGDIVKITQEKFSIKSTPGWGSMPDRNWDSSIWVADNSKIMKNFGWKPNFTFSEGFEATLKWFVNNPKIQEYYSINRKLPI